MTTQLVTLKPQPQLQLSPIKINPQIHKINSAQFLSRSRFTATVSVSSPEVSWEKRLPPNAVRRKRDSTWRGGFSLGIDLGLSRTGLAISKGFIVRPLTVLELRGQKLELRLLDIAEKQSSDGKETVQSNKVRSVAGRLAVRAAERGWRVYLQNEHGTSVEAMDHLVTMGLRKSIRQGRVDAYAAMKVLERYFSRSGQGIELVLPKQDELQKKLCEGPPKDVDFFPEESTV